MTKVCALCSKVFPVKHPNYNTSISQQYCGTRCARLVMKGTSGKTPKGIKNKLLSSQTDLGGNTFEDFTAIPIWRTIKQNGSANNQGF